MNDQITFVNLTIDDKQVQVPKGTTVYTAAKQLGIELPIFCYQDRMPPFGACRVCLVEVEKMPKLQTSCTLEATEGMVVRTQAHAAVKGREEILEFLLINHPLDCPICDRGGECPLQDQTMKFGPGKSRFFETKRHFPKPVPRGPVLMLDRERCVVCARCTRFADLIAGDNALELVDRGYRTEVGTPNDGPAESKFIGNTIQICPVGALTSRVYRFRARPWDNASTNSTCTLCPVGCSMILDARDGEVMRTRSLENPEVNDMWLCDKGWFGYEFSSHPDRLHTPLIKRAGQFEPASWDEALSLVAQKFTEAKPSGTLAALGGNALTFEESYLFQKLMRDGAGVNHIDHRVGMPIFDLDQEGIAPGMEMSIGQTEKLSYAVLFGLDLTEEFPVIWLRLKQALNHGAKVFFFGHFAPEMARHLTQTILHAPGEELKILQQYLPEMQNLTDKKGALFVGRQYLASNDRLSILSEISQWQQKMSNFTLNLLEGRGNSIGARLAGMHPRLGPFNARLSNPGLNVLQIIEAAAKNGWEYLHVAGADPASHLPKELWLQARAKLKFLVVQDLFLTETAQDADVVLPTLCFVEKEGTFINIEGRKQKLKPGKAIPETILSDGEIFVHLGKKLEVPLEFNFSDWNYEIIKNQRMQSNQSTHKTVYAGELFATFTPALFDYGVRMKHNPHLIQMAKEPTVRLHPQEAKKRGIRESEMVRLKANGKSITAKIHLDSTVALKTIVLPLGFDQIPVYELSANPINGLPIELEKV